MSHKKNFSDRLERETVEVDFKQEVRVLNSGIIVAF